MRFTIVGLGYVGTSAAALMSRKHHVSVIDISADKLENIRRNISPVGYDDLKTFLRTRARISALRKIRKKPIVRLISF